MPTPHPSNKEILDTLTTHIRSDNELQATLATKADLEELSKSIQELKDTMQPLIDLLAVLNSFNRFLKWGGITFFAFIGLMYFLIKR